MTTAFYPPFCNASIHFALVTLPEKPPHVLSHMAFHVWQEVTVKLFHCSLPHNSIYSAVTSIRYLFITIFIVLSCPCTAVSTLTIRLLGQGLSFFSDCGQYLVQYNLCWSSFLLPQCNY